MTPVNQTSGYRRYEFFTLPRKLISSYALKSAGSHIVAAKLGMNVLGLAARANLKLEQVKASRREDLSAQIVESLHIQTLRELLLWENRRTSDPIECCLPFVDVAFDALALTALEILTSDTRNLFPTTSQILAAFREAFPKDDDRPILKKYYHNYVRRLLLFSLTQYADLDIGPDRYFQSLARRNLYFFSTTYSCETAVAKLEIPPSEQPIYKVSLKEAVARTGEVADRIRSMPFVSGLACPKLKKKTILCGTEKSIHAAKEDEDTIFLDGDSPDRNVIFRCSKIERGIGAHLSSMSRDLVEVATYVFAGDVLVRRTARWRRSLKFVIPVRNLKRWKTIAADLSMITSFISGDHISFKFVKRHIEEGKRNFVGKPVSGDCVCLLSGGQDSFAGSLELLRGGRHPVLVGHFKQSRVAKSQRLVADALKRFTTKKLSALRLDVGLAPGREKHDFKRKLEYTQRLRSFLFLSLATAVADGLGLHEIFIPENGVLAFNVPLAACRTGSRSTRSAHPRFLWYFEKIVNQLYGRRFKVRNPLIFKTKAEVLKIFKGTEIAGDLVKTISCSRYSYGVMMDKRRKGCNCTYWDKHERKEGRDCTHCGACLACLIRRAAMIKADLADQDAEYIVQPFVKFASRKKDASLTEGERLGLLHLIDFCKAISDLPDDQILLRHPQLFLPNQYFPNAAKRSIAALKAARMYRRFANEIIEVVKETASGEAEAVSPLLQICGLADDN